ncbi:MAG: DUF928 domain-containing protein [Scytonema sp. PMC 1069.18]|nr:DUF928 domain-containing protein [Scytonema sp. PMC 1069.18]MEC4883862.1 DUF928 domain-containing protein [Scytonema sp. PMC 1070.18]
MFSTHLLSTRWVKVSLSSTLVVALLIGSTPPSFAVFQEILSFLGFQKRNVKKVADGRSRSGAGRGECSNLPITGTERQLTALIPPVEISPLPSSLSSSQFEASTTPSKLDSSSTTVWLKSYTIEEKPIFWFYIPYKYDEQSQLEFAKLAVIDEQKQLNKATPIYFKLPEKPGIVQVKLPIRLEEKKPYKWFFSIICDKNKPSRNPSVAGWIERLPRQRVQTIKPSDSILTKSYYTYARKELWYDAFTQLVQAYQLTKQQNNNYFTSNFERTATEVKKDWLDFFKVLQFSEQDDENERIAREIADSPISKLECVRNKDTQICD